MKTSKFVFAIIGLALAFTSCKKKDVKGDVTLNLGYSIDAADFYTDSIMYQNAAGNHYSVTHLEYYLSDITLGSTVVDPFASTEVFLINANTASTISLVDVPAGQYNTVTLTIGLSPARNTSFSLPNTVANNAMAWPDMMGGGYHFMKFEGYYLDSLGQQEGFAIHLGKTGHQVTCTIPISIDIQEEGASVALKMNLNEWFRNPNTYDFNVDGASIMTNDAALQKIAENGVDVLY